MLDGLKINKSPNEFDRTVKFRGCTINSLMHFRQCILQGFVDINSFNAMVEGFFGMVKSPQDVRVYIILSKEKMTIERFINNWIDFSCTNDK